MRQIRSLGMMALAITCFACVSQAQTFDRPSVLPSANYPNTGYPTTNTTNTPNASAWSNYNAGGPTVGTGVTPAPMVHYDAFKSGAGCKGGCKGHCKCGCWFGRVGSNYMTRDDENPVWYSYDTANVASALLGSRDAEPEWGWGPDAMIGRTFGGGCYALEIGYWGVYPDSGSATVFDPDGIALSASDLGTPFTFDSLEYNGTALVDYFDNAFTHRLDRHYQVHNVEVNLVGGAGGMLTDPCPSGCCFNAKWRWLAGVRYFKFNDGMDFMADDADNVYDGDVNEVTYSIDVDNHAIGGQIGGVMDYCVGPRLAFYAGAKVGVYGVRMEHNSVIRGSAGTAVINNAASPFDGQAFNITSTKNDVAFIGELDLGGRYKITPHWNAILGYRALAVTGVGLSSNQIPRQFGDLSGVADIDSNGSLILHGGYGGLEFAY